MDDSEDNMSSEDVKKVDSSSLIKKPKKRSLVERELETNMTARMTSPAAVGEGLSTSRYGRARRLKTNAELIESQKVLLASMKSPTNENTPVKVQSPVYRMHASNSPQKVETPQKALVTYLDNQIDNIYQENISLSRFSEDTNSQSPAKKYPKVYIRKDLIQNREEEESIMLIQHLFSPTNSGSKQSPLPTTTLTTPNVASVQSTEKYVKQNGYIDNSSVVKTLDFDNKIIKKKEDKGQRGTLSKNELFEIEATCPYQVGDLAWARVGTFPFWPCIITRDPYSEMYVKKKLFGRVTHDIIHVTFFGDNGRRSWIVDNMLRKYLGLLEFESTREKFTSEDKKKDPRLYAAFFVSDKKQALWNMSVQEAETLLREPKRLRIDVFNDMLWKSRASKKPPKSNKISSRTNSDVSLSESLYDSLFSEKEDKPDEIEHSKKSKNKSFDVSEVVTACLDNMAAKTGITKIQRQSHMDRWLQKAKSKTPEKTQAKTTVMKMDKPEKNKKKYSPPGKLNRKSNFTINSNSVSHNKPYRFRRKTESQSTLTKFVNQNDLNNCTKINDSKISSTELSGMKSASCDENINKENNSTLNISTVILVDDADDVKNTTISKDEPIVQNIGESVNENSHTIKVGKADSISDQTVGVNIHNSKIMPVRDDLNDMKNQVNQKTTIDEAKTADTEFHENKSIEISAVDSTIVTSRSTNDLNADTVIQSEESVLSSVTQRDANSAQPVELSKENSNVFVETICNKSDLNNQDSLTDFDKKSSDVETIQKQNENKCFSDLTDNLIMEVDNCPNFDSEANGDKNPDSKTVSNKNMGSNIVSDLKEAQNDVTIEVSVTEKKNDETLNNLPREGEQEIVNKPNPSKINKPNIDTTLFLHEILNKEIVSTDEVIAPEKTSTPEKTEIHKINEKFRNATAKKFNLESDITLSSSSNNNIRNEEDARELKDGCIDNCTKNVGAEGSYDGELDDGNVTMDCINDKLNDTGNSESVLHVYTEEPVIEKDEAVLDTSLNVSTQSESILENSQIDGGAQENDAMIETVADIRNEIGFVAEENERSASCQCVESPTFTQYIDSEDLFRDVSDKHSSSEKHNKQLIKPKEMTVKEVEKKTQIDNIKEIDDDYDDTSEDEPSPEYESLDDEITEDFRKHMMSIESNIKDSKDEEQIVKICNEIAEKAKLSPTKYGEDQEISKSIDKIDTNSNNVLITSSKDNIELKIKNNYDKVDNEKVNDSSLGEHDIKVDMKSIQTNLLDILDSSIYKQNKLKELQIEARKSLNLTDEQTPIVVKTDVAENVKDNTAQSNEISTKVNGDADLLEIPDKPKMIYRTRSSTTSASKDRASPDVKIKSSVIEKYIKRCEYEPKVVIIRLERDKLEYSKGTNKSKHLDEDKPGCNENHIEYVSKEDDIDDNRIRIENKAENIKNKRSVVDKEDKNIKSRLSLRRKSKTTENNIIHNHSEIKAAKPTNTSVLIMKEVVKTSKQIEIKNDIKMDEIVTSEPIKLNGYHHNLYRKFTGTPDSLDDTDFDLDAASVNSEDSEVSLPNSIESMPRRNLRSRPEKTLEYALKSPEFLKYLEVRQDYLMDLHPELNADEVVAYIHKSWQYEEGLKSDSKIIEDVRKQETPSRSKKSKKTDPKNRIKDYFCENYEKSKKTINFDSEPGAIDNSTKIFEQKMETNTEKNISKIETSEKLKKLSNSSESVDLTLDTINDISIDKDKCDMDTVSVESEESSTPRRSLRSKTAPKCLNKDIYYLDDILVLDGTIQKERDLNDKPATEEKIKKGQDLNNKTSKEKVQKDQHVTNENILENKLNLQDSLLCEENTQNKRDLTDTPRKKIQKDRDLKHNSTLENKILKEHDLDVKISLDEKIENERDLNAKSTPEEKIQKDRDIKETPISKEKTHKVRDNKKSSTPEEKIQKYKTVEKKIQRELDIDSESVDSEDSEIPLRQLRSKVLKENENMNGTKKVIGSENKLKVTASKEPIVNIEIKDEQDEIASTVSDNEPLVKQKQKPADKKSIDDPAFIQYLQLKQDSLMDENPQLSQEEIIQYLYKSWLYDEKAKSALDMNNELEKLATSPSDKIAPIKKVRLKQKVEKQTENPVITPREKPRRRIAQPFYNENYSDIEDELEVFEIFKTKKSAITVVSKAETDKDKSPSAKTTQVSPKATTSNDKAQNIDNEPLQVIEDDDDLEYANDTEIYFADLTKPKPNVFKGLIREKVCEICEYAGSLVKCKVCYGMFHPDCVKNQVEQSIEVKESPLPIKGRKKRRKLIRKSKTEDSESQSDEKSHDMSADTSIEDIVPPELLSIDAQYIESQLEAKMKDILTSTDINYDSYSSDDGIDWESSIPGKCEIVDVKLKRRDPPIDYSDFKCNDCLKHGVPVCFVCKSAVSKTNVKMRQKCHIAHCHKYYHLECLDHWPQTQFVSGEPSKSNKKKNEFFDALTCPRHVCHTCVSDDPRGCKTRFSWDKLAKCVRCPATYHSFNKCLPAGTQVLTASHIICPRHSEQKGRIPCHVNTGWCFICALGGSLICCEYCPTSFHAECLNIKPPEGNYMCEDCETGRLPLYGEMVWVKLGQYRWWPGIILHPSEIPENIMAVKHELGDFVVRFFGQYDHYWVNRGRVFPYQEGDSGKISSQKSKINEDFICAMEHAQRAYAILKNAVPDEEESLDIASSLLPPHYVKLKSNKPSGALCGRRIEDPALSLTQCECDPAEPDPCGPYSQCLNRMLLTECGPTCRAGERCNNRAFEKRLYPKLVPYRTPHRGWGLKTLEDIKAGQFVIEYVGELIDEEEYRRRMRRKHEIRDENFYFLTLDKERMIDAGPKGNVARFMNHCCEPNCETQKWTVLGDIRVGLFAIQDIPANSEVTFNYNLECAGIEKKLCLCGAKRCSGYIGAKPKQDESQSKKGKEVKIKRAYNKKKKPEGSPSTVVKIKKRLGRPPKPKPLTEIEKDVLIIKNATSLSSDIIKIEDKGLKKKITSMPSEQVSLCNGKGETKSLKRKRISISMEEVSICNGHEPCAKKQKCVTSEVGD